MNTDGNVTGINDADESDEESTSQPAVEDRRRGLRCVSSATYRSTITEEDGARLRELLAVFKQAHRRTKHEGEDDPPQAA